MRLIQEQAVPCCRMPGRSFALFAVLLPGFLCGCRCRVLICPGGAHMGSRQRVCSAPTRPPMPEYAKCRHHLRQVQDRRFGWLRASFLYMLSLSGASSRPSKSKLPGPCCCGLRPSHFLKTFDWNGIRRIWYGLVLMGLLCFASPACFKVRHCELSAFMMP